MIELIMSLSSKSWTGSYYLELSENFSNMQFSEV